MAKDEEGGEMLEIEGLEEGGSTPVEGGEMIDLEDQAEELASNAEAQEHFVNLVDTLEETELGKLGMDLMLLIEDDIAGRKERDKIYAEGIKRTGLGDEAPGGATFEGASKTVHPLLIEAGIDFAARAMKELFPASGPVKQHVPGTNSKDKIEKARRKTKHMNWQLTKQIKEFRAELEQTLTQLPLAGAGYMKVYHDDRFKRPATEFIAMDDMIYPTAAAAFTTAERKTHRRKMTEMKMKRMIADKVYRDLNLVAPMEPEQTEAEKATDKVEGKSTSSENRDGVRTIYETYCYLDIESEDEYRPYIVTIDDSSRRVLSIYRNWKKDDPQFEELQHIVEFPFIPWRGAAPIGLTHMIGSLSGAATGALRALLDSAHIANSQAAFKLKGGSKGGQTVKVNPNEVTEIDGSFASDDIRKVIMPMPFNGPSPVLFELLGFVIEQGRGVVRTTFEGIADQKTDMPVGTTLALIEQGMVVFSAIHARLHSSMAQVLEIIHRINADYMTSQDVKDEVGEVLAKPGDYEGPMDVIPVSDPNIFSEVQRQAQVALIAGRAATVPGLYNLHRVEKMVLEYAKIPAPEELLIPQPEPEKENAVNENLKATIGKPIVAYPDQDHEAHIATHVAYIQHPLFGGNPAIVNGLMPIMVSHLRDHLALWYVQKVVDLATQVTGVDVSKLMDKDDDDVSKAFDRAIQHASAAVLNSFNSDQTAQMLSPVIQQAMQIVQANQPPPPMDPSAVQAQEVQRKQAADQAKQQADQAKMAAEQQARERQFMAEEAARQQKAQLEQAKLDLAARDQQIKEMQSAIAAQAQQQKAREAAQKAAVEAQRLQNEQRKIDSDRAMAAQQQANENQRNQVDNQTKVAINTADNQTALAIAAAEIESGEKVAVSTGGGVNPGS
jgi:hypothetical protein